MNAIYESGRFGICILFTKFLSLKSVPEPIMIIMHLEWEKISLKIK